MSSSTPATADFNVEEPDDDVSLGGTEPSPRPTRTAADLTATDHVPGVLLYTHGSSVRVGFNVPVAQVLDALTRCGWSENPLDGTWNTSSPSAGTRRYVVRGSKWLNERPPGNKKLPLVGLNRHWKTRLYSVGVDVKEGEVHVDLQAIRHGDIKRFLEDVLGLKAGEYAIDYYRTIERFFVLPPHEAFRLAEQLDSRPSNGRGRLARVRSLVKDHPVPLTVRQRSKRLASLVVYRIDRGATAAYKVELRLREKRRGRGQFDAADIAKLDRALLELVRQHDLHPMAKPARWEPRTFTTGIERGAYDEYAKRISQRAWRGGQVPQWLRALVQKCHTPHGVNWVVGAEDDGGFPRPTRIRSGVSSQQLQTPSPSSTPGGWKRVEGDGFEVTRYEHTEESSQLLIEDRSRTTDPWTSTARDIASSHLYLHEVVLHPEQDPGPLLEALGAGVLGSVGATCLCAVDGEGHPDAWFSVLEFVTAHPFGAEDVDTFVLLIHPSASSAVDGAVVGRLDIDVGPDGLPTHAWEFERGPLLQHPDADVMATTSRAMGASLGDLFEGLRHIGEETGVRFVLVTVDARPDHGRGGMRRSHYFRDARVRSSVGDAGRYYCHQRYLVERVVRTRFRKAYTVTTHDEESGETYVDEYAARVDYDYFPGNVTVIKDEAEGLVGRLVYERARRFPC